MSKLIYADSLRQDILALPNCYNGFSDTYDKACIIGVIDEQQPVDAVPVVRCKDCIYFDKYIDCKEMYQWDGFCADWARNTYENWYCSRAERRSDE